VLTHDGRRLEATVLHAKGSVEHPLSDQEIEAKVRALAPVARIDEVIAAVWQIDTLANVGALLCASC
jgi:2-methylcitrate dehydratase PrpD